MFFRNKKKMRIITPSRYINISRRHTIPCIPSNYRRQAKANIFQQLFFFLLPQIVPYAKGFSGSK